MYSSLDEFLFPDEHGDARLLSVLFAHAVWRGEADYLV
jgi:hypothetical protein